MKKLWAVALIFVLMFAASLVAYQQGAASTSSPVNLRPGQRISVGFAHRDGSCTVVRQEGSWVQVSDSATDAPQRWINLNQAEWMTIP